MKRLTKVFTAILGFASVATLFFSCGGGGGEMPTLVEAIDTTPPPPPPPPHMEYGFYVDSFDVMVIDTTQQDQVISDILLKYGIGWGEMAVLGERCEGVFNLNRDMRPDRRYILLCTGDTALRADYMVYQINAIDYVVFDFGDSIQAYKESFPLEIRESYSSGYIKQGSSLWLTLNNSIENKDIVNSLVDEISNAYAWTIDFFNIKAGDTYKIIYDEKYVEDKLVARGRVKALYFSHAGTDYYGIKFTQDSSESYFDEQGKGLRKAFLKAPLKFSRISSGYSKKRFHPVQKRYKAHLGTDYAAPKGTPIWSVGEGTVIARGYSKGNGNYVKVKHNDTYTTQYLHMSKFADIKKGQHVTQGQVIGYVGSTGLATGPHVCFRFWKNGKQVDHRQEKFQTSEPIKEENMEAFEQIKLDFKAQLDSVQVPIPVEVPAES
jgi:murein DD-endopeptidase MepM/ murein hydrolase activator NlpD